MLLWTMFQGIYSTYPDISLLLYFLQSLNFHLTIMYIHRSSDSGNSNMGADQVMSQYSSTVTEVVSGKNMNVQGN